MKLFFERARGIDITPLISCIHLGTSSIIQLYLKPSLRHTYRPHQCTYCTKIYNFYACSSVESDNPHIISFSFQANTWHYFSP